MRLPDRGLGPEEVVARMDVLKDGDADWRGGRTWSLVYPAGGDVDDVLRAAHDRYLFENALNPARFPSLRRMERDVVDMTAGLLHAPDGFSGSMTSGGTESILLAVKTARDRARAERDVTVGTVVAPVTAHPAFAKACHLLDLELVQAPAGDDYRVGADALRDLVDDRTVLVVASAPNYPFGTIDPVPAVAGIAAEAAVACHVDACLGGFLLPFWERIGLAVPPFDFRVDGVTSMSADVHKYGYATKGASVLLHRDRDGLRHQAFAFDRWPGGAYGTLAMAGARPAAPVAAAWAVMQYLGADGYQRLARAVAGTTARVLEAIASTGVLRTIGSPDMSVVAFGSDAVDPMAVGDRMDERGWHLDRQAPPPALHLMVSPEHAKVVDAFAGDLVWAAANPGTARGAEARYA